MKREERNEIINRLKEEINLRLTTASTQKIAEMILWLVGDKDYQELKGVDSQLIKLDLFINIWRQEMKGKNAFEMQGDVFEGINSIKALEEKYEVARLVLLRVEMGMPYELCMEGIRRLIDYKFSPYALLHIALKETRKCENNIKILARFYREYNELVKAIGLLQIGVSVFPQNEDMLIEVAEMWLEAGQCNKAYEFLCKIESPSEEIQELRIELEKSINYEIH